jgi:dienelactone hydrolase
MRGRTSLLTLSLATLLIQACAGSQTRAPDTATPSASGAESTSTSASPSAPAVAAREIATEEVSYRAGTTELKGFLAYPKDATGKLPGVLVVHEWWGLNDYARSRARSLAELGYVALAADMYGGGRSSSHPPDAKAMMMEVMSKPEEAALRFDAARTTLAQHARVDASKLAAIGYCMGGALVLGAARRGSDFDLVASFHGNYATQTPLKKATFAGKIFIAHGAADSFTPPEQAEAVKKELEAAGANYEFVAYEGAKHGFTNPEATELGQKNAMDVAYDAEADAASWRKLQQLLAQAFAQP